MSAHGALKDQVIVYCIRFTPGDSFDHSKNIYQQNLLAHS